MNIYQEVSVSQSKICSKCKIEKSHTEFNPRKDRITGVRSTCKMCESIRRKIYYENNKVKEKASAKLQSKEYKKEYRQNNRGLINSYTAKRRCIQFNATPEWANLDEIKKLYDTSVEISLISGIQHHVDHIVPLQSEIVCGLHCIANLQIISSSENYSKSNRYWPDMP